MLQKLSKFGAALMPPVLFFSIAGLILAIVLALNNPMIVGQVANEGTFYNAILSIIESGAWAVFTHIELLFAVGLAIGLAKMEKGRAGLTALIIYLTFNVFIGSILSYFGETLNIDFFGDVGAGTGLRYVAGVRTLDTNIIGAIFISALAVWIHNRYFTKKLPDIFAVFQGSTFVYLVGFFLMIPVAVVTVLVWPIIQNLIGSMQVFMANSGIFGVWAYTFSERILIPTGLHHFIWQPFMLGPAVTPGGIEPTWLYYMGEFAASSRPLIEQFPQGGFALHGMSKVFGALGIAAAFYKTAKPEKKKKVLSILMPVTLTAMLTGITEPLEFTFLFIAPVLFAVHAVLAATLSAVTYAFGVVGLFSNGLIQFAFINWIPLGANHWLTYVTQVIIGLIFSGIYFVIFRFLILKFDFKTPGREDDHQEVKLFSKKNYKDKKESENNKFTRQAAAYVNALGGRDNLLEINNCITRLRVTVKDTTVLADDAVFKAIGAHGIVRKKEAIQVIIGGDVTMVRAEVDQLVK